MIACGEGNVISGGADGGSLQSDRKGVVSGQRARDSSALSGGQRNGVALNGIGAGNVHTVLHATHDVLYKVVEGAVSVEGGVVVVGYGHAHGRDVLLVGANVGACGEGVGYGRGAGSGDLTVAGLPSVEILDHGGAGFVREVGSTAGAIPVSLYTVGGSGCIHLLGLGSAVGVGCGELLVEGEGDAALYGSNVKAIGAVVEAGGDLQRAVGLYHAGGGLVGSEGQGIAITGQRPGAGALVSAGCVGHGEGAVGLHGQSDVEVHGHLTHSNTKGGLVDTGLQRALVLGSLRSLAGSGDLTVAGLPSVEVVDLGGAGRVGEASLTNGAGPVSLYTVGGSGCVHLLGLGSGVSLDSDLAGAGLPGVEGVDLSGASLVREVGRAAGTVPVGFYAGGGAGCVHLLSLGGAVGVGLLGLRASYCNQQHQHHSQNECENAFHCSFLLKILLGVFISRRRNDNGRSAPVRFLRQRAGERCDKARWPWGNGWQSDRCWGDRWGCAPRL